MRQIDSMPHARLKVSVFEWEGKWIVKVEKDGLEQIFKFRQEGAFGQWPELKARLDDEFMAKAEQLLVHMRKLRDSRYPAPDDEDQWPNIL